MLCRWEANFLLDHRKRTLESLLLSQELVANNRISSPWRRMERKKSVYSIEEANQEEWIITLHHEDEIDFFWRVFLLLWRCESRSLRLACFFFFFLNSRSALSFCFNYLPLWLVTQSFFYFWDEALPRDPSHLNWIKVKADGWERKERRKKSIPFFRMLERPFFRQCELKLYF
jgi:hypothetical protein